MDLERQSQILLVFDGGPIEPRSNKLQLNNCILVALSLFDFIFSMSVSAAQRPVFLRFFGQLLKVDNLLLPRKYRPFQQ